MTKRPYLTTDEFKNLVIDQLIHEKVFHITFMGGEPFLREDFDEIFRYAVNKGMYVKIQTNGSLIDSATAQVIKEAGVQQVEVSLDGVNPATNHYIRGQGTFNSAINALSILKKAEIPRVGICFTITKHSLGQIEDASRLRSLTTLMKFSSIYAPMSPDDALNKELSLSMEENKNAVERFRQLQICNPDMVLFAITDCEAAKRVCAIGPSGDVRPCTLHSAVAGNILETRFRDIWYNSPIFKSIRWPYKHKSSCNLCGAKFACAQTFCSAKEFQNSGKIISDACLRIEA